MFVNCSCVQDKLHNASLHQAKGGPCSNAECTSTWIIDQCFTVLTTALVGTRLVGNAILTFRYLSTVLPAGVTARQCRVTVDVDWCLAEPDLLCADTNSCVHNYYADAGNDNKIISTVCTVIIVVVFVCFLSLFVICVFFLYSYAAFVIFLVVVESELITSN